MTACLEASLLSTLDAQDTPVLMSASFKGLNGRHGWYYAVLLLEGGESICQEVHGRVACNLSPRLTGLHCF